jgi:hypothetical protein
MKRLEEVEGKMRAKCLRTVKLWTTEEKLFYYRGKPVEA